MTYTINTGNISRKKAMKSLAQLMADYRNDINLHEYNVDKIIDLLCGEL